MKIVKPSSTQVQTLKGIALVLTGWLLLMVTIIFGGAAFGYLVDINPTRSHGAETALYLAAVFAALGWDIWLTEKGVHLDKKARSNETTEKQEVKQ